MIATRKIKKEDVSSMIELPLHWIKQIENILIDTRAVPLSGHAPSFPWKAFSEKIAAVLQGQQIRISPRQTQFLKGSEISSGLGAGYLAIAIDLTPLEGQAYWLMGKEDVAKLSALSLAPSNGSKGLSSAKFQEGFYYYLLNEALLIADGLKAFEDLLPKMGKTASLPMEEALCIDVEIHHHKQTLWGRLVCPASLHEAFKAHFSAPKPLDLTDPLVKAIDLSLGIELGRTALSLSEWKTLRPGDLIILERCTFDPQTHKGTATLTLNQSPLLRARIKENTLKIVDYASYREEPHPMEPHIPPDEENPEEIPSAEFEAEEPSEENHIWSSENHTVEKIVSTSEIPLILTVEVARLHITLERMLQLSPGNVLELPVKPEQGVDLLIGGKKVGKAELVKLGEMLGVKILKLED